jgi:hypothetical protein
MCVPDVLLTDKSEKTQKLTTQHFYMHAQYQGRINILEVYEQSQKF